MSINAYTLKAIADCQLLFSSFNADQSLFNGKTGIMLFFFQYDRFISSHYYKDLAGKYLKNISMHLSTNILINILDSIYGIRWSIQYINKQSFVDALLRCISYKRPFDSNYLDNIKTAYLKAGLDCQSEYYKVSAVRNCIIDLFKKISFIFERSNREKDLFVLETATLPFKW